MTRIPKGRSRRGHTAVEMAAILMILLNMLFGIIEFGLYMALLHTANVAAFSAARLAVVSTNDSTINDASLITKATNTMAGTQKLLFDPTGTTPGSPTITLQSFPYSKGITTSSPWKSAGFGDPIIIEINGVYKLITPIKIFCRNAGVDAVARMGSEAN